MKIYPFILFLPLLLIGACSSSDNASAPATSSTEPVSDKTTAPKRVSSDNPFSTQLNALESAKQVSGAAKKSIDRQQQVLDTSAP